VEAADDASVGLNLQKTVSEQADMRSWKKKRRKRIKRRRTSSGM